MVSKDDDEQLAFNIGDLVKWNSDLDGGGPPWYVDFERGTNAKYGIVYDITRDGNVSGTTGRVLSYMVRWDNGFIFPAGENELKIVAKAVQNED
jgi:hypothetical protein